MKDDRPVEPLPPPCRIFKAIPFVGNIETEESKNATKKWVEENKDNDIYPDS